MNQYSLVPHPVVKESLFIHFLIQSLKNESTADTSSSSHSTNPLSQSVLQFLATAVLTQPAHLIVSFGQATCYVLCCHQLHHFPDCRGDTHNSCLPYHVSLVSKVAGHRRNTRRHANKTGNVHAINVTPLLQWKSSKYYIF